MRPAAGTATPLEDAEQDAQPLTLKVVRAEAEKVGKSGSDDEKKAVMMSWRMLAEDDRAVSCKSVAALLNVRVSDLRGKPDIDDSDDRDDKTQADVLVSYADDYALFIDARGDAAFADVDVNGHREVHQIDSKGFRDCLRSRYFLDTGKSARGEAVAQAVATIEARARFADPVVRHGVFLRSANVGEKVYLDAGRDDWGVYEIDAHGWKYVGQSEVRFRRTKESLPLAEPVRGGSIGELLPLLNTKSCDDFILSVGFLLQSLRGKPKYAHVVLRGEQGTGKSAYAMMLRSIADPANSELRSPPRNEDDLFTAAQSTHLLAYDNLTSVQPWLSDAFCRMGDGGTLGKRKHYTNDEEATLRGGRPMIFNGISEAITASDLADRVVFINLEPISEEERIDDEVLAEMQDKVRGKILGALLDAVSCGLQNLPTTKVERMPRMASFARWVVACEPIFVGTNIGQTADGEPVLWRQGDFIAAYRANRAGAAEAVLGADIVACELREWLPSTQGWSSEPKEWSGTPTALFQELCTYAGNRIGGSAKTKGWPTSASAMTNAIRRAAPALRGIGIDFSESRSARKRTILLRDTTQSEDAKARSGSSQSSRSSSNGGGDKPAEQNRDDHDDLKQTMDARASRDDEDEIL